MSAQEDLDVRALYDRLVSEHPPYPPFVPFSRAERRMLKRDGLTDAEIAAKERSFEEAHGYRELAHRIRVGVAAQRKMFADIGIHIPAGEDEE